MPHDKMTAAGLRPDRVNEFCESRRPPPSKGFASEPSQRLQSGCFCGAAARSRKAGTYWRRAPPPIASVSSRGADSEHLQSAHPVVTSADASASAMDRIARRRRNSSSGPPCPNPPHVTGACGALRHNPVPSWIRGASAGGGNCGCHWEPDVARSHHAVARFVLEREMGFVRNTGGACGGPHPVWRIIAYRITDAV
jgi:hypothetical protein